MRALRLATPNAVLLLLCAMYTILYIDRVNISTAAPLIQTELRLSNTQLGLAFSAFAYSYALFQLFGGWLGDRFGARRTLCVSLLIVCIATALTGAAGGLLSLFCMRVALGFGEGAALPTATHAMTRWIPEARWGFAQGITHSFARIGNFAAPPIVALLIGWSSWRASFFILAGASLVWMAVWFWFFRDRPHDHPSMTREELALLPSRVGEEQASVPWLRSGAADRAGQRGRFLLWLDAVAVPDLDSVFLCAELSSQSHKFGALFLGRFSRRRGGRHARRHRKRPNSASIRKSRVRAAQRDRGWISRRLRVPGSRGPGA